MELNGPNRTRRPAQAAMRGLGVPTIARPGIWM